MEIVCQKCQSKFKIADADLPEGRTVTVQCVKCGERIEVGAKETPDSRTSKTDQQAKTTDAKVVSFDASEKPFDYLQEGVESALLCEHDLEIRQQIHTVLDNMKYHVVEAASARNALKYMRFHTYNLVVVNEGFEATGSNGNHVLQYLSQLPIAVRREMFVLLLSRSFRTMDNIIAFNKSVNLVVNLENVQDTEKILKGALSEHRNFYRVFRESLVKMGRA